MKKNKKKQENINSPASDIINRQTRRQRETLERERIKTEKSRNALFKKRVNTASEQKVPKTVRTKAYYRFSKNYPSVVDPEGYRENTAEKDKFSVKGRIILSLSCVVIFVVSLFAVQTGVELSKKSRIPTGTVPEEESYQPLKAERISPAFFANSTAEEIRARISGNAILIDIKDEEGTVFLKENTYSSAKDGKTASELNEKLTELKQIHGIDSIAYISCFKDSSKPYEYTGMEIMTSLGEFFIDSGRSLWLNPFSELSQDYILSIIKNAADCGFTYILLDYVCFPTEFSVSAPYYGDNSDNTARNQALLSFINKAVNTAGADKLILCCDITAFSSISELPNEKYGGTLLSSDCYSYCLDLRTAEQPTAQLKNSEDFSYIEEMPLAFVLDAGILAKESIGKAKEGYVLFALSDSKDTRITDYINHSGIENIIIE